MLFLQHSVNERDCDLLVKLHVVGDDDTTLGVRNVTVDIVLQ
jgi:hypothetical protein